MRNRTAKWFECKIALEKTMEDGLLKRVTEQYVVNADSFADAEIAVVKAVTPYISGEFEVKDIKQAPYKEVFFMNTDADTDSQWYKAKLDFITIDEKTMREKRSRVTYLVEACSLRNALDNIDAVMEGTMIDYVQANVGETKIEEVIEVAATPPAGKAQEE